MNDLRLRFIRRTTIGIATLGLLSSFAVAPAFAATQVDEEIDFSITGVPLAIETATATNFTDEVKYQFSGAPETTASNYMYTATDLTGNVTAGWTVSVLGEDLTATEGTIAMAQIAVNSVSVVAIDGDDETGVTPTNVAAMTDEGQAILTAVGAAGDGEYDHTVNILVTVPNETPAGTYTSTLTFTIAPSP